MKKSTFLKLFIGFAILGALIYKIGIKDIFSVVSKMNVAYLPVILVIILIVNFFGAWKLILLFRPTSSKIRFLKLCHIYFLSGCLSLFIPGRAGELLLIYFLKKEKVKLGIGSALVIIDKIIATIDTFILALAGIFIFFNTSQSLEIIGLFMIGFSACIYMIFSNFGRGILRRLILRRWESHFAGFSKTLSLTVKKNKPAIFYNFALGLVKWILYASVLYLLFRAFGQNVSVFMVLLATATLSFVSLVPISLNGLGLKESLGVVLFALIGVSATVTASVFLALLIINYVISAAYIALFFEERYKPNIRKLLGK